MEAELRKEPTANEGACDSYEEVAEIPEPGALHDWPASIFVASSCINKLTNFRQAQEMQVLSKRRACRK